MNPSAVLSAIADRANDIMHAHRHDTQTGLLALPTRVDGRVFRRLHEFARLPPEIKAQTDAVAVYLGSSPVVDTLFTTSIFWSLGANKGRAIGPTIRGDRLVNTILKYLVESRAANASDHTAQQLAETLVLSGFLSPVHERDHEPQTVDVRADQQQPHVVGRGSYYIQPREYYELVSSAVLHAIATKDLDHHDNHDDPNRLQAERLDTAIDDEIGRAAQAPKSVWDVVDGATRAGSVFRKQPPSLLHTLVAAVACCRAPSPGHEKPSYVVVNRVRFDALFVFRDDVARQALACVPLRDAMVQYELGSRDSPMYHGLKLWTDTHTERFDFMSRHEQHEWLLALLDGGAKYKESCPGIQQLIASPFYSLRDVTASGTVVAMGDVVRGKVVVLVNVASKDPNAALQLPELVTLWDKYHSDGLAIMACPSDQFLGLELDSEHAIVTHLQHAYNVRFRVLAKRDVNGPQAREAFLYCNAHVPGAWGPFTEWNFTKFLLDRTGKPYRRYETHVLPHEMEGDIRRLLGHGRSRRREHDPPMPSPEGAEQVTRELRPDRVAHEIQHEPPYRHPH